MKQFQKILDDLKQIKADFRINDLDESLEVSLDESAWSPFDDTTDAIINMRLRDLGYGSRKRNKPSFDAVGKAFLVRGDQQRYNPIRIYFEKLRQEPYQPQQTNEGQYKPYLLHDFCLAMFDNPDGMFSTWLFRWMAGAVAKLFWQERNPILVLTGEQEIGKSTFIRWLCPIPERFREGPIRPDSKDDRFRLADMFIQEIPELGSTTRRADVEAFKDHITRKFIHERPFFGKRPVKKPAVCSFVASVNFDGAGFLVDSTGSSRFLVTEINHINFAYQKNNVDLYWREILWFVDHTFRPWELTPSEKEDRRKINAQYQMVNPLSDLLEAHFQITHDPADFLTTSDIKTWVEPHYKITNEIQFARELAKTLKMAGLERKRGSYSEGQPHRWGYGGIKRKTPDNPKELSSK